MRLLLAQAMRSMAAFTDRRRGGAPFCHLAVKRRERRQRGRAGRAAGALGGALAFAAGCAGADGSGSGSSARLRPLSGAISRAMRRSLRPQASASGCDGAIYRPASRLRPQGYEPNRMAQEARSRSRLRSEPKKKSPRAGPTMALPVSCATIRRRKAPSRLGLGAIRPQATGQPVAPDRAVDRKAPAGGRADARAADRPIVGRDSSARRKKRGQRFCASPPAPRRDAFRPRRQTLKAHLAQRDATLLDKDFSD